MPPQLLEMVAGWRPQIAVRRRIVDHLDLAEQAIFQISGNFLRSDVVDEERVQPVIPETHNHATTPFELMYHPMTHIASALGFDVILAVQSLGGLAMVMNVGGGAQQVVSDRGVRDDGPRRGR